MVSGVSKTGFDREDAFFYLQDHLGSPIRIVGGEVNQPLSYDSFGVEGHSPSIDKFVNPFGFTRYQRENVGGMLYAQARYYMPQQGRFNTEDGARDGLNWYEYARSNPLRFVDPSGMRPFPICRTRYYPLYWIK